MSLEWFKEWFETEEYLNVYQHRNEKEAETLVDLIIENVCLPDSGSVLDLACGTGRHARLFAARGYKVTAVDLSRKMLDVARSKSYQENLEINFIQQDLRHFSYSGHFDLIINLFTSFGYFDSDEENMGIFRKAYDNLQDDGYFVIDFFNRYFLEKNLIARSEDKAGDAAIIQTRRFEGLRVIKEISIKKNGHSRNYTESVRMFSADELSEELNKIGFAIEKTFGDFQGNQYDKFSSPRIILIAKK